MKENNNNIITAIVIATLVIAGSLIYFGSQKGSSKSFEEQLAEYQKEQAQEQIDAQQEAKAKALEMAKNVPGISDEDQVYGNPDAGMTIYEYSDFECPFCERYYQTPKTIVDESEGDINLVFRHFPLEFHGQVALDEALAAECAGEQGKFWEMHDAIFSQTDKNGKGIEGGVEAAAESIGLDMDAFKACMESEKYKEKVLADLQSGADAGVRGTPGTIIVNNETGEIVVIPGAYPIEAVQERIQTIQ